ncbi:glycosyltransferase [Mycolicibacterium rhodesiae]|uniref:Glycosyl transferase family 1 n=1 Tax=Mycolicibacterium rhodesiae TaxID=36814 RepID=A0A1X0IM81_MYCRH|nr:glycosyltransferase [Mycolicibacterium rhodesiae]MCV7347670.1 glycosyltransferase [Mycolicibacterium rhodesiae]ORB49224.1 glycosyl transferase family 1 [Mycolicibacterium rhodesiae]
MKIALAVYGTRGDVEPMLAVGRELVRRGHEVRAAVPPDLFGLAEYAGFAAEPYGHDSQEMLAKEAGANLFGESTYRFWQVRKIAKIYRESWDDSSRLRRELSTALIPLAQGTDLLFHGQLFEDLADNVAEHLGIPMVVLHHIPLRPNNAFLWFVPAPAGRAVMTAFWWVTSRIAGSAEKRERRQLGLPKDSRAATHRITERGSLEIQAYDEVCYPGLAAEWIDYARHRPFVGTLTLEQPTGHDDDVTDWIATGAPPICFNFGSMALKSPADTIAMIGHVCTQLGERALVCAGSSGFSTNSPRAEHVKVVGSMNHSAIFPACRAVVHHGGAGTTAAVLRAGVPHLVLWSAPDRWAHGAVVTRLKVGISRRFSGDLTENALIGELRELLAPSYRDRAREIATQMKTSTEGVRVAADSIEEFARSRSVS